MYLFLEGFWQKKKNPVKGTSKDEHMLADTNPFLASAAVKADSCSSHDDLLLTSERDLVSCDTSEEKMSHFS